jgi:uncharacterized protein YgiM (DUF1202 family)
MKRMTWTLVLALILLLVSVQVAPALAQTNLVWTAEYFNNTILLGPPAARNYVTSMNFNWGAGAPYTNGPIDNWSARYGAVQAFAAGTYRFTITADDGVHLFVNGQKIIDTYASPRAGQAISADITLPAGEYHLQVDFVELTGNAFLYLTWGLASGPLPQPATPVPQPVSNTWTAEYFNNRNLSGSPVMIIGEASPTHDWGTGAPAPSLPADGFSVRWTSTQQFTAGTYRLIVQVDDGVRVYVNGVRVIDRWYGSPQIATYSADVQMFNGSNTIVIEYYEDTLTARIAFSISYLGGGSAPVSGASFTCNTWRLNVRSAPFVGDNVLLRISKGETYSVTGRNPANTWVQIQVGSVAGWVNASYGILSNAGAVPVIDMQISAPNAPAATGYVLRSNANLNIRSGAGLSFSRLGILPLNAVASILARNGDNSWWMISYGSLTGWISGYYVSLQANIDYNRVPIR